MTESELIDWGLNPKFITPEFLASIECSATLPERFAKRVVKTDGCWLWPQGEKYGVIGKGPYKSGMMGAHVASFILHNGPVESTHEICHSCDNPKCVRPDHLFMGTRKDNMSDCSRKGRAKGINSNRERLGEESPNHKFTNEQVLKMVELRSQGSNYPTIAAQIGCSISAVALVCQGRIWSHLTGIPIPTGEKRKIKRFTNEEKTEIERLHNEGKGPREIARKLDRNYGSVHTFIKSINLRN